MKTLTEIKWLRCLNCKTGVAQEAESCPKCGDRLKPRSAPVRMRPADLTSGQARALGMALNWYRSESGKPFRLFGAAGTGKTYLARRIADGIGFPVVFGAYTGKAASVLRNKGCPAATIHSAVYRPIEDPSVRFELKAAREEYARTPTAKLEQLIAELGRQLRRPGFEFNEESPWGEAGLIILDEVSMVNEKMASDIERLGVPILVLGDPAQLPPIGGAGYYTDAVPDIELDEVVRQAADSPVLELATRIRLSEGDGLGVRKSEVVRPDIEAAIAADQVIVWRNDRRWTNIAAMRKRRGLPMAPVVGDRVMCLANNRTLGILNGVQYDVHDVQRDALGYALVVSESGDGERMRIRAFAEGFEGPAGEEKLKEYPAWRGLVGAFTFADVITVHKAQGSEWGNVYICGELPFRDARRWLYTGVTRASESVTIAVSR